MRTHLKFVPTKIFVTLAILLIGCEQPTVYTCVGGGVLPPGSMDELVPIAAVVSELSTQRRVLYPRGPIEVCWEDDTFLESYSECRSIVQRAINTTWGAAFRHPLAPAETQVRFVGWTRCSEGNENGIRIRVTNEEWNNTPICSRNPITDARENCSYDNNPGWPRALLGRQGAGERNNLRIYCFEPSAESNVLCSGATWPVPTDPLITRDMAQQAAINCISAVATHEFGHSLGFTHESDRPDFGPFCGGPTADIRPDILLGPPNPQSIMGCGKDYSTWPGYLHESDFEWARAIYYPEYSDAMCAIYGRTPEYEYGALGLQRSDSGGGLPAQPRVESEIFSPRTIDQIIESAQEQDPPGAASAEDET